MTWARDIYLRYDICSVYPNRLSEPKHSSKEFSMHSFPHRYYVDAAAGPGGTVTVSSPGLDDIESTPPPEFDGPEGYWSPETLLVSAVSDCFILTFRGIAKANQLDWTKIKVETEGILDRVDRVTSFTEFHVKATLQILADSDEEKAHRLLEKAKQGCLITNSFKAATMLTTEVLIAEPHLT
jgi:organic hydroperoxide reductase OsmC/OhrA